MSDDYLTDRKPFCVWGYLAACRGGDVSTGGQKGHFTGTVVQLLLVSCRCTQPNNDYCKVTCRSKLKFNYPKTACITRKDAGSVCQTVLHLSGLLPLPSSLQCLFVPPTPSSLSSPSWLSLSCWSCCFMQHLVPDTKFHRNYE